MSTDENILTLNEFFAIKRNLEAISDVWSDLWTMLYLSQIRPLRLLTLKYDDLTNDRQTFVAAGKFKKCNIELRPGIQKIIQARRKRYPDDVFLFQSHSNCRKSSPCPVTLIAFNTALKRAAVGVTKKAVSSNSAFTVTLTE